MTNSRVHGLRIHGLILIAMALAAPALAQQSAEAAKAPATAPAPASTPEPVAPVAAAASAAQTSATSTKPDGPTGETLVKARKAGYHTRIRHGIVLFCKEEAQLGTRFKEEHCLNEDQFGLNMEREQAQRDQLTNRTCTGCSGK